MLYIVNTTGEAWPADTDSTSGAEGRDGKGVKCNKIRKTKEPFPAFHVRMGEQVSLHCEMFTGKQFITD